MAKYILNNSDDDLDFVVTGISSSEDQYTIISLIDRALQTRFSLDDYIPFNLKAGRIFKFSLYRYLDEELGLDYVLIPNSSNFEEPNAAVQEQGLFSGIEVEENTRLIKELPKVDFLLILKGEDIYAYQHRIIEKLKSIPELLQVSAIDITELPSRRNLIF